MIERQFGEKYHPGHGWRIPRDMGWRAQKSERRARERDEVAIRHRREETRPQVKKARREGWSIVLIDKSEFML